MFTLSPKFNFQLNVTNKSGKKYHNLSDEDLALRDIQQNKDTFFDPKVMFSDITGKQKKITLKKVPKNNVKVRGTADDWELTPCHIHLKCSLFYSIF